MSSRPPVDRERIDVFLDALGRRFRGSGRIYLTGGTTLVYEELRGQTLDIDLTFAVDSAKRGEFVRAVRDLKDELNLNVEEVSPAHFVPLPLGFERRARFLGRFGGLEVFHFDPYSTALSKIERAREEDIHDVLAMLRVGLIDWADLQNAFYEILPRVESESLNVDPEEFTRKLELVKARWEKLG